MATEAIETDRSFSVTVDRPSTEASGSQWGSEVASEDEPELAPESLGAGSDPAAASEMELESPSDVGLSFSRGSSGSQIPPSSSAQSDPQNQTLSPSADPSGAPADETGDLAPTPEPLSRSWWQQLGQRLSRFLWGAGD